MKKIRTLGLLLGALCGAAGFAAESTKPSTAPKPRPPGHHLVSTLDMKDTMHGRKSVIIWNCYAEHNGAKPTKRTNTWLEGQLKGRHPGIDLWDIGAQHRSAKIKVRVVAPDGSYVPVVRVTDDSGNPVPATSQPAEDGNKFIVIEPNKGVAARNRYEIQSNTPNLRIEAYYGAHPPTADFDVVVSFAQIEDGGPPSNPPVNEN